MAFRESKISELKIGPCWGFGGPEATKVDVNDVVNPCNFRFSMKKKANDWAEVQYTRSIQVSLHTCLLIRNMLSKISTYMSKACRFTASPVVSWSNKSLLRRQRETWKLLMLLWRTQRQGTRLATQTHRPNPTWLKRIAQHRLNKMVYFYSWYLSTLTACQLLFITVSYTVPRTMQL